MKKRIVSALLALCMVLTLCPMTAFAVESDFEIEDGVLIEYNGSGGAVAIPSGVTHIGDSAFCFRTDLTSVSIPSSVIEIGERAFYGCDRLKDIYYDGSEAQWNAIHLHKTDNLAILIRNALFKAAIHYNSIGPDSAAKSGVCGENLNWSLDGNGILTISGEGPMYDYHFLSITQGNSSPWWSYAPEFWQIVIQNGVTTIGDYAFANCGWVTDVSIPNSVTSIGEAAFLECNFSSVTIPEGVTTIERWAFQGCENLNSITIPNSISSIGMSAFLSCTNLTDIYYTGTEAQWNAVVIANYNDSLNNATSHYSSSSPVPTVGGFSDVKEGVWYADAVLWAVEQGITVGTGTNNFSPERTCSQVEIITFLWRATGEPTATTTAPIEVASYFQDAVNWAYGQNIIDGGFDPSAPCTRADTVQYMWKTQGSPEAIGSSFFSDVPMDASYGTAVQWAVANNVTKGTSDTTFSPSITCDRSQIVTFLYRVYAD